MTYATRVPTRNTDGSPLFAMGLDRANEEATAALVASRWNCEIHPFGRLSPVDFYALRDGRLVGVLELKSRTHDSGKFATVFLNVRKWLALVLAENGLGCPAIFVVKFTDTVKFIPVNEVDASRVRIGGTAQIVKSESDIEPVIEVEIGRMQKL